MVKIRILSTGSSEEDFVFLGILIRFLARKPHYTGMKFEPRNVKYSTNTSKISEIVITKSFHPLPSPAPPSFLKGWPEFQTGHVSGDIFS